jgi:predicted acylesterase/phospholipase RssA
MMSEDKVPKMQRALVLQGGGALGAYNTGVFQALYERIDAEKMVDSYLM